MKNGILKHLARLLAPRYTPQREDRFLIVSTTGLGDTLWALPALRALRKAYPTAYISCLTTPLGAEVLKHNPLLTETLVLRPSRLLSLIRTYLTLRRRKIHTAFLFHTSHRVVLPLCVAAGIPRRIGTSRLQKGLDSLLSEAVPSRNDEHEVERRLNLIKVIIPSAVPISSPSTWSPPPTMKIGLHPGAKDRFKQWPATSFIQLGHMLHAHTGAPLIITGTPEEQSLLSSIASEVPGAQVHIEPLSKMIELLSTLSLFITNDTGPMHLAAMLHVPVLGLFGPTHHTQCGPYLSPNAHVLQVSPTCAPCLKKRCLSPFCLRQITPHDVFTKSLEILKL